MTGKNDYEERSRNVDLEYPHLGEDDKFELFGLQGFEDGKKIVRVTNVELSEGQKRVFERTSEIYSSFKKIQKLYEMYLSDYAEFNKSLNDYEKTVPKKSKDNFSQEDDFNRRLIHILSSSVLFVTYFENEMKRVYGKKSLEFIEWKKELGAVYDRDFAYRFCYHLRNYTQHEGLAIARISITTGNENPEKKCTCNLEIVPERLIATSYSWNKKIEIELKNIKGSINLRHLLNDLFKSMMSIYVIENTFFLEANHEELTGLIQMHKVLYPENKLPCLVPTSKQELKNGEINTITPLPSLMDINRIYVDLSKIGLVDLIK